MKKFISLLLTLAMVLSLAVPALAAEPAVTGEKSGEVTAAFAPEIYLSGISITGDTVTYDPETETYTEHKIEVPMLFIQEENYDTLIADVKATNGIDISVTVGIVDHLKLLSDYDELVPAFIETKDTVTPDIIIDYIGNKITFEEVE